MRSPHRDPVAVAQLLAADLLPVQVGPVGGAEVAQDDLQVRAVPSSQLPTTEVGVVVELAPGPCVVMGPEGAASP